MWISGSTTTILFKEEKKQAQDKKKDDKKTGREFDMCSWQPKGLSGVDYYLEAVRQQRPNFTMIISYCQGKKKD